MAAAIIAPWPSPESWWDYGHDQDARPGDDGAAARPSAVAFVTTEHFTLPGARAAAITESTSRASIFIGSVSTGLVALGLIATATRIGTAFYAFGLILLWTLSFLGLVTFDRVLRVCSRRCGRG